MIVWFVLALFTCSFVALSGFQALTGFKTLKQEQKLGAFTNKSSLRASFGSCSLLAVLISMLTAAAYVGVDSGLSRLSWIHDTKKFSPQAKQFLTANTFELERSVLEDSSGEQLGLLLNQIQHEVHKQPKNPVLWFKVSGLYESLGAFDQALHALRQAQRLDEQNQAYALAVARLELEHVGSLSATTKQRLTKVLDQNPADQTALSLLVLDAVRSADKTALNQLLNQIGSAEQQTTDQQALKRFGMLRRLALGRLGQS